MRSYFPDTAWLFDVLVSAESRLRNAGILDAAELGDSFFRARGGGDVSLGYMGDDHLPFLRRGVSVLHIIAEPFPRVWHTLGVSGLLSPAPCLFAARLSSSFFCCSIADVGLGLVDRTERGRSISRRYAHGTSSFASSSPNISDCVQNCHGAQNRHLQRILPRP